MKQNYATGFAPSGTAAGQRTAMGRQRTCNAWKRHPLFLFITLLLFAFVGGAKATITGSGSQANPYVISSNDDWETFAGWINSSSNATYANKYYRLDADITVSTMAGTSTNKFKGTFNGAGHTMTLKLTSNGEFCAPFRYVDGATIKRVHTTGTVTASSKYGTGLIGESAGTVKVSNCWSSVTIVSSVNGDGTHGGFIGVSGGNTTVTNCRFDGVICATAENLTYSCGGFVGWRNGTLSISNSLYAPAAIPDGKYSLYTSHTNDNSATFTRNNNNSVASSCHYTSTLKTAQGTAVGADSNTNTPETLASALGLGWQVSGDLVVPVFTAYDLSADGIINGLSATYIYNNGNAIDLGSWSVMDGNGNPLANSQYTYTIKNSSNQAVTTVTDEDTYTLTVTGQSPYSGSVTMTFCVGKLSTDANGNYLINNANDWLTFVGLVSGGISFSGETVKLTTDINVTSKVGVVAGSTQEKPFSGTFDGQHNTITANITDTDNQGTALFCYIEGATIKDLTVAGSITGGMHAAAIVGFSKGTGNKIEGCKATVTVNGGTHIGGILGHGLNSDISIKDCLFSGKLVGGDTAKGVIFGWGDDGGTKTLTGCLYLVQEGQVVTNLDLVKKNGGTVTVTNCYRTTASGEYGTRVYTYAPNNEISSSLTVCGVSLYGLVTVNGLKANYALTGNAIPVNYTLTAIDGTELTRGTHYTAAITKDGNTVSEVKDMGTYTLTLTAVAGSGYKGEKSVTFEVINYLTVNEGTNTTSYAPVYGIYKSSYVQMIYTASQLQSAGITGVCTINKIGFNSSSANSQARKPVIYICQTDKSSFSSNTDFVSINAFTKVYDFNDHSEWSIAAGWNEFELDTPFEYDGTSNLVVAVHCGLVVNYASTSFYAATTTGYQTIYAYSDTSDPNPSTFEGNWSSYNSDNINRSQNLPSLKVYYDPTNITCFKPTKLTVSNITAKSADLSWTSDADTWEICINGDEENLIQVTSKSYELTGLTPETTYTVKVRVCCSATDHSSWSNTVEFTTAVACPKPEDLAVSDITGSTASVSWTGLADAYNLRYRTAKGFNYGFETAEPWAVDEFPPCTTYDGDKLKTYGISEYDMPNANYYGSVIAFSDNDYWAAHSGNTMGVFMADIPDGEVTANDDYFITPALTIANGDHFIFWARSVSSNYGLERMKVGVYGGNGTISTYFAGSATEYIEVPVDWTQYDYDLTAYAGQTIQLAINCVSADAFALCIDDLFVGNLNDDKWDYTLTNVSSPQTLTQLTPETDYEVQVQSVCGGEYGESEWSDLLPFTTAESFMRPSGLTNATPEATSVELSWTANGGESAWVIAYGVKDDTFSLETAETVEVDENPYTLTGLTPETEYIVYVRAKKDNVLSEWCNKPCIFTTITATPLPTDLTITPYPDKADISWSGSAESYEVQHGEFTTSEEPVCLTYNVTHSSNYGSSSGEYTRTWGTMYPASQITGNFLTSVSIFESEYNTGDFTINIYSGGDDAPGTLLCTVQEPTHLDNNMHEVKVAVPIDPNENLWITLTEKSQYGLACGTCSDNNNRWIVDDGIWTTWSVADLGWMMDASIMNTNFSTIDWTTATTSENTVSLTNLKEETTYMARIKGYYGDFGHSDWAFLLFTTPAKTDVPIDLAATDITSTTATLNWTGYQESYKLQWRTAGICNNQDFENGMGDWTVVYTDNGPVISSSAGRNGKGFRFSSFNSADSYDQYLISPRLINESAVSFWYKNSSSNGDEVFKVGYSSTTPDIDSFTWGEQVTASNQNWTEYSEEIPAGTKYVAIHYYSEYQYYLYIDDITFTGGIPNGEWQTAENVTAPYSMTGLTPGTKYEWQVQGNLTEGTTDWSEAVTFTSFDGLELADNDSEKPAGEKNADIISGDDGTPKDVMLVGRTLYKDGAWNTLCLPFDMTATQVTAQLAPTELKKLDTSDTGYDHPTGIDGATLYLNFKNTTTISAGTPYIIKWTSGSNIENPTFTGVTIDNTVRDVETSDGKVTFKGTYEYLSFNNDDKSILLLGEGNTLYWPQPDLTDASNPVYPSIGAFRAYFQLNGGLTVGDIKEARLNFGDGEETQGIKSLTPDPSPKGEGSIYTLNGVKLDKMPTRKGIYIRNGRKVVIK